MAAGVVVAAAAGVAGAAGASGLPTQDRILKVINVEAYVLSRRL